jgi:hypothetical protein
LPAYYATAGTVVKSLYGSANINAPFVVDLTSSFASVKYFAIQKEGLVDPTLIMIALDTPTPGKVTVTGPGGTLTINYFAVGT